jgi:hypothetical protein
MSGSSNERGHSPPNEAIDNRGDVRRLGDLFGVSVATVQRYADVVFEPDGRALTGVDDVGMSLDLHTV